MNTDFIQKLETDTKSILTPYDEAVDKVSFIIEIVNIQNGYISDEHSEWILYYILFDDVHSEFHQILRLIINETH